MKCNNCYSGNNWLHHSNVPYDFSSVWPVTHPSFEAGFRVIRELGQKSDSKHPVVLVPRGAPLSSTAMVQRPAPIPGVRSWSVEFAGQLGIAYNVDWNASGDLIATNDGGNNRTVKLWNKDGTLATILLGHEGPVTDVSFSPDGKRLVTGCMGHGYYENNQIRIWDVASGRCERSITVPRWVWDLVWSPDGRYIAAGGTTEQCLIMNTETGDMVYLSLPASTGIGAGQLAFNAAGDRLYVVTNQKSIATYSVPSGTLLDPLDVDSIVDGQRAAEFIDVSPDGKSLAGGTRDGRVRFWDLATGKISHEVDVSMSIVRQLILSPDGESIAITGSSPGGAQSPPNR